MKGIGTEKTIKSVIKIHTDAEGKKITQVEDRWDGEIPEGAFAKVRFLDPFSWLDLLDPLVWVMFWRKVLSPFWWIEYGMGWNIWFLYRIWETRLWEVREVSLSSYRS